MMKANVRAMARAWRIVIPLTLIGAVVACTTEPEPTAPAPNVQATVQAEVVNQLAAVPTATAWPTHTPYPTATAYPTATPYPTGTPLPTASPYPTATPYPTYTPYPTPTEAATPTPQPTYTPYPTQRHLRSLSSSRRFRRPLRWTPQRCSDRRLVRSLNWTPPEGQTPFCGVTSWEAPTAVRLRS